MEIESQEPKLASEGEEQGYNFQNLPLSIAIDDSTVAIHSTVMQINSEGFTFLKEKQNDQWFTINTTFSNTTSVGISGNNLMIFVGDQENQDDEEMPEILTIISKSTAGGNVNLMGYSFVINVDFSKEGKNVLKEVHDIFVNNMGDADDNMSRYDEDEDFEQMISADDIDQNGYIIGNCKLEDDSEDEEQENQNYQK